jgi:hypothetical protein
VRLELGFAAWTHAKFLEVFSGVFSVFVGFVIMRFAKSRVFFFFLPMVELESNFMVRKECTCRLCKILDYYSI